MRHIHFPGLTGPFFRLFWAILRALLSLSLSPYNQHQLVCAFQLLAPQRLQLVPQS